MRFSRTSFILLLLFISLTGNEILAQQRIRFKAFEVRSSGLLVRGDLVQFRESLISPLAYTGSGGQVDIFRLKEGEYSRNYFNLGLDLQYAKNRFGLEALLIQPEFVISHTWMSSLAYNDKQKILLGAAFSAKPYVFNFRDESADKLHWITSYTLDFHYILEQELGRTRKFWLEFQIPLAGVVFRPDPEIMYEFQLPGLLELTKRLHSRPYLASLHNMQAGTFRAFVDLVAGERGAISVGYESDFYSFAKPVRATIITHSLTMRLMFNRLII